MYDLEKKQFLPLIIAVSLLFLPPIIGLTISSILNFQQHILLILLLLIVIYVLIICIIYKITNSKSKMMEITNQGLLIHVYKKGKLIHKGTIKYSDIEFIYYYRMTSIKSWLATLHFVSPKSVYIKYKKEKNINDELLGFMDYCEVVKLSNDKKIKLKVY